MAQQDSTASHWATVGFEDEDHGLYVGVCFDHDDNGSTYVEVVQILSHDGPGAADITALIKPEYVAMLGDKAHRAVMAEERECNAHARIEAYQSRLAA